MPLKQRLILVIDDELVVRETFERTFEGHPEIVVFPVKSVELALQTVHAAIFDLVFLDVRFEDGRSGMEVLEELRKVEEEEKVKGRPFFTKVIIMSGNVRYDDISKRAQELLIFSFIAKPADFTSEFVRAVVEKFDLLR